ncbi:vanadium-dependent haloperoxidase [Mariniflexile litorale]|uniref:Vanadium-dependent haloperoxidase n=1 Tax=Mariniflexile litorale TaxID=3045158 RepID=A0AAU7EG36_9FLAO|nr:vanadium-dependent haloperoxidase [Mariniflexile sp. KMM 9835]MDQ8211925.1 vanadium-dependent haloperoxidase [Mariniflexile sp. KMM 9835]
MLKNKIYKNDLIRIKSASILVAFLFLVGCKKEPVLQIDSLKNGTYFNETVKQLTDIIVHDVFSPPVASRIYAYPSIAAYECLIFGNGNFMSMAGQLNGLNPIPKPKKEEVYNFEVAALKAYIDVGKSLVFSEEKFDPYEKELFDKIKNDGLDKAILKRSLKYGELVALHILEWVDKDNYKQTRTMSKYPVSEDDASWRPTPPDYMDGIEPDWNKIRTFIIDSASQFIPDPPTPFNLKKGSVFYKEIMEVYNTGKNLNKEEDAIAKFWDCNPFVSHHQGHAMFATKKITPGGHWIGITSIAIKKQGLNFQEAVEAYTRVSVALADAFISCWDEKYRSVLIRPETLINQYIDANWMPLLQTPPFPEYTSGHSVVSGAASVVLTDLFGDDFYFNDTSEVEFGLPTRQFNSFNDAAEEAAISRLYGGIHYMPAIKNGVSQGRKVGGFVVNHLTTRK